MIRKRFRWQGESRRLKRDGLTTKCKEEQAIGWGRAARDEELAILKRSEESGQKAGLRSR